MAEPRPIADQATRERALDPSRSFIVQAPAGSGKTGLLIQRYLALLACANAPEEIVAITFTRKAAAEMRNRVLGALAAAAGPAPEPPHELKTWELARAAVARARAQGWDLAANPTRLRVQTIDSLCSALTRQMPVLSGFGAQPELVEDAAALFDEAARRTLALLDVRGSRAGHVGTLLAHLDNDVGRAEGLVAAMLARRDQWLRHVADPESLRIRRETLEAGLAHLTCDVLAALAVECPPPAGAEIASLAAYAADQLAAARTESPLLACRGMTALPGAASEDLPRWLGIAEMLLTRQGGLRRAVNARQGFPAAGGARGAERQRRENAMRAIEALLARLAGERAFLDRLHETRSLPPPRYEDAQWKAVAAVVGLLPLAVAELELLFRERGQADFTAVAQAAVRALGEPDAPTDLALALDYRIHHILLDEFQDTSLSQYELVERLTAGWQGDDGRTLFLVGDPMQSIYRFREAEVGLYLRARREGIGAVRLEPLTLTVNFRSQEGIVRWVNAAFARALPQAEDLASGAVPYVACEADRAALPGEAVTVHAFTAPDRNAEAQRVAALVASARQENPAGTIAILVRSRLHVAAIAPALKRAGVRFQAIEIEELGHRAVVQDLFALTRALVHPADRIAWLAVLRAPWCGLTLADFVALAGADHDATLWELMNDIARGAQLSADGQERLARARSVLGAALGRRRREPLRRWIEGAWLALGGPAGAENEADLGDAAVFFGLLEELEQGGDLPDLGELEERVAKLFAVPDADDAARAVQVMTIHKAKGLEFDTVIVPGLGYATRAEEQKLLLWLERPRNLPPLPPGERVGANARVRGETDLLLAPVKESAAEAEPIYRYIAKLDGVKNAHEAGRLLYVAATRARSRLHLLGHARPNARDELRPDARSLLAKLWDTVAPAFARAAEEAAGANAAAPAAPPMPPAEIRRVVSGWEPPLPAGGLAWRAPEVVARAESPHDAVEFSWASETAKQVGTVVHRFLQLVAEEGLDRWDARRVGAVREIFARDLRRLGVPDSELKAAVARVHDALTACLGAERGRWLLTARADARSELRLTGVVEGRLASVAMDRTFVDETGTRWIVDYKTGTHEGADVEAFLDREQERYREQLEQYCALMRGMDGRPIRLGLYFPLLNGWRDWEPR
jgi:ATP-dependent exoDNAse (exonuclease V) beta subunit